MNLTAMPNISNVETIGAGQFRNYTITSITIPDSVTSIGNNAFGQCKNLQTLVLPIVGGTGTLISMFGSTAESHMPAALTVTIKDLSIDPAAVFAGCADYDVVDENGTYYVIVR